ncbi:MAG: VanZ family protein [Reichenbachiella sp.]
MIKALLSIEPKYYKVLFIGWSLTILFLLLRSGGGEPSWLDQIPHFDKVAHFSVFAIWMGLMLLSEFKVNIYIPFILLFSFAFLTEVLQAYVPGRSMDVLDALVDVLGGLAAFILLKTLKKN